VKPPYALSDVSTHGISEERCCHVWMAPFMQGFFRLMLIVTKSGHVSGLLARYTLPLALMKSAYRAPNQTNEL
jgi:hypothetical protein